MSAGRNERNHYDQQRTLEMEEGAIGRQKIRTEFGGSSGESVIIYHSPLNTGSFSDLYYY